MNLESAGPARPAGDRFAIALCGITLALLALLGVDALAWLRGVGSNVWIWGLAPRRPGVEILPAVALAAALVLLATTGLPRRLAGRRGAHGALLAACILLGWGLHLALLAPEPAGVVRTLIARTIDPSFTSYHTVAVWAMPDGARAFLETHHERLAELPLHAATHPPGPSLYYRAWLRLFDRRPEWAAAVTRAIDMDNPPALARLQPPQTPASIAAALLGAAGLLLAGALAAWPVAALVRRLTGSSELALRAAALWPLVPGVALMSPEFDQALALPVAACAAALVSGSSATDRSQRIGAGLLAGVAAALALFLSYGAFAFLAGAGLAALAAATGRAGPGRWTPFVLGGAVAAGLFFVTGLVGHRPFAAAIEALALHGTRHTWGGDRPWAISTGLNLADTLLFVGPPLVMLLFAGARRWQPVGRHDLRELPPAARWSAALVATFALFLLSGTVRGEAGRIFVPWMPLLLAAALCAAEAPPGRRRLAAVALATAVWTVALRLLLRVP